MSKLTTIGAVTIPSAGANYTDYKTVLAVQAALKDHGFKGKDGKTLKLDGIMGPNTAYAISSAQFSAGIPQTGRIDEGVISMFKVTPGVLPPGVSAQAKAAVEAQAALDAATAAEHAVTPSDVQVAAAKVVAAAPAQPPELKQAAEQAHAATLAAVTPAQVQAAKEQVQVVAAQVQAAVAPNWMRAPLWDGAPIVRWQALVGGAAVLVAGIGIVYVARKR